ncbi:MAG: deoxyribodipyrimidine photolyase, partial [Alphaproteobacteria bacterium]
MEVVWFKRDLRVHDHSPLLQAAARGSVLPLYIVEPSLWAAPDASARQWRFVVDSLHDLGERCARLGSPLRIIRGEAVDVFEGLRRQGEFSLWAHEETGNGLTYARDRAVRAWAKARGVPFRELPNGGVVRRLGSRDDWDGIFDARLKLPLLAPPETLRNPGLELSTVVPELELASDPAEGQPGGRKAALAVFASFLEERGKEYPRALSSPVTAFDACSRLSPHLAFGTLSGREALRILHRRIETTEDSTWRGSYRALATRIRWRDHFIQKLESEPEIEFENMVRGFDGMRDPCPDAERLAAWAGGRTGFPMVDACMRCLIATGWINFRMRAMLQSFASYSLWLHWREPGLHLSRLFVDYEPGIHWAQAQMQSGTIGVGSVRLYNPTKQGMDQDPRGEFIARWVPELAELPSVYRLEPRLLTPEIRRRVGYPPPLVELSDAHAFARTRLSEFRERLDLQE